MLYGENDNYIYNIAKECIYKIQGKYHVGSFAAEYDDSLIIEIIGDDGLSKTYEKKSVNEIGEKLWKLSINNLTKNYGNFTALNSFTYEFTPGVYGLLGP